MRRYLNVKNDRLISERFGTMAVEGEFEATGEFENVRVGMVKINGLWQEDPQQIIKLQTQQRIAELKELITNKKLLDMDCIVEQNELKELLGL